jgi:hypothetical protein
MHIIIFGPNNEIHSLHKIMRDRNPGATCVVGATVDEIERQYALGSVKTRGPYTLIFAHYIPGRYGEPSSEGNREEWKSTFMRSVLSCFGQTDPTGTLKWYFTEEDNTASIMWKLSERPVSECITIARALETSFLALSGGTRDIRNNLNKAQSASETKHPPLPSTPQPSATRQCPCCGSSSLGERKVTLTVTRAVDRTRRIARDFDAIELYCQQCGVVLNNDLRGDIARAYSHLGDVRPSFDIDKKVAEVMQGARNLPEISDADVDNNFEDVREVWECLKVVTIPERDLQSTVLRLIRGYAQEGVSDLMVPRYEQNQNILQINFLFDSSFQGVRIARKAGGSFAAYGCTSMYRLVGDAFGDVEGGR